jgi:anti-sigma factor RsiW
LLKEGMAGRMEHSDIQERCLIDRYVQGHLPDAEREAFEEHFVDCPSCLAQLETARALSEGMKAMGSAPLPAAPVRVRNWRLGLAMAASLAVGLVPGALLYGQWQRARGAAEAPAVYVLSQIRGSAAPVSVESPGASRWVVLVLQVDASGFRRYQGTLRNSRGEVLWQSEPIRPSSADSVAVSIPSAALVAGDCTLALEGLADGRPATAVAEFPFSARR